MIQSAALDSMWKADVVPSAWHFLLAVYFAVGFAVARFLFDKHLLQRVATWLLSNGSIPLKINKARRMKIAKCSESLWKLTYYATVELSVLLVIYGEPWFTDIQEYFRGWPNQHLKPSIKLIYMCQCGFYIYSISALLTWETRRKDFAVMMSHHVVTVILISYSYITRFFRIGSIILALHDASDVFMEAAKVFKYSEKEFGASVCFGLFALSWLVLRLIYFPFWVIRSSRFASQTDTYDASLYYVFNTMLLTLLVFHIYWWFLICAMIMRQLKNRGKVGEDIRSDSEDDD
ncbi:LAG1 longevity assurance homolog 2 isoform X2 [Coffea eugenioides]|uniref:LAG1 longevity assurance homolog 2 isoform X2 n=1 Tax=Coffea eugenioides TaxID=49369 RepID=UPI000F6074FA|nr:LAG1 longevity assurance homolog 2 isoform X2 [Coffea eugenioides]